MDIEKKKVNVIIDGKTYTLVTSDFPEKIRKIGEYVNKKINEISNASYSIDTRSTAVLTCINIADDYFKALEDADNLRIQTANYIKDAEKARNEIKQLNEEIRRLKTHIKR